MNSPSAFLKSVLVLVLAALALVPVGAADAMPLENASAQLQLNGALAKKLKKEGVGTVALKPAGAKGARLTLPATEASLEPRFGSGYLYLGGGFRWRAGKKVATVRRLLLNIEKRSLNAVVNGTTMKLAELAPQQLSLNGFAFTDAVQSVKLTGRAASTFNRRLGLPGLFKAGRPLGSIVASGSFLELQVTGGEITLTVDDAFRQKLRSVEADVRAPSVSMPVQGGRLTSGLSGFVQGENGLTIFQPNKSELGEPVERTIGFITTSISLESGKVSGAANVTFPRPGTLGYSGQLATIPTSPVRFDAATGEAGATFSMALDASMAALLNETVGASREKTSLFSAGEPLGTVSFTARTR
jgi:hypothetical protein